MAKHTYTEDALNDLLNKRIAMDFIESLSASCDEASDLITDYPLYQSNEIDSEFFDTDSFC